MSLSFEMYIGASWTDVTSYILKCEGELKTENITDEVVATVISTLENIVPLETGLEFRIKNDTVYPFAGTITSIKKQGDNNRTLVIRSYSYQFHQMIVNEYYKSKSPEYIVEDLLDKYTDFTYASSVTTGITLDELTIKDKKLVDVLDTLITIMQYQIRLDYDKNVYLEPRGVQDTGLTLSVGTEITNAPDWEDNTDNIINKVTFIGDYQTFNITEYFNGDGSTVEFTLKYNPVNVIVTVDSVVQDPEVVGATVTGDYKVNNDEKTITFNVGSTPGIGTDNVVVNYTYKVLVKLEAEAKSGMPADEIRWKKIENKSIKTFRDARQYLGQLFNRYAVILPSCDTIRVKQWYPTITNNSTAEFKDVSANIDNELVINSISFSYPETGITLQVGDEGKSFVDYQAEAFKKIQELESGLSSQDVIQKYIPSVIDNDMIYENRYNKVTKTSITGTTGIYDSPAFGIWDTATYEDPSVGSFILGHPTFGKLGTAQLGDGGRQTVEVFLESSEKRFVELFYDDDFKDSGTGDWDTTNEWLELEDTEDMTSEIFAKDLENTTDNVYKSVSISMTGTGLNDLVFYIGEYDGVTTTYSAVTLTGTATSKTGTLSLTNTNRRGLNWKAEADGGTVLINKLVISYTK